MPRFAAQPRPELACPDADGRVLGRNPHAIERVSPQVLRLGDPADLLVFEAPCPFARLQNHSNSYSGMEKSLCTTTDAISTVPSAHCQ